MRFTALCAVVLSAGQYVTGAAIRSNYAPKGPFLPSSQNISVPHGSNASNGTATLLKPGPAPVVNSHGIPKPHGTLGPDGTVINANGKPITVSGIIFGPSPAGADFPVTVAVTSSVTPSVTASSDIFTLPTVPVSVSKGTTVTASSDIFTLPTVPVSVSKGTTVTASSDIFTLPTVPASVPKGTIEPIHTVLNDIHTVFNGIHTVSNEMHNVVDDVFELIPRDDVAEDDTDVEPCKRGYCGDSCPAKNDGGGWVTIGSVDCENIPINTVTASPTDNAQGKRDDNPPPTPLPDLPEYGLPLIRHLGDMQQKLHDEDEYLDIHAGNAVGKWYPFGKDKVVAGMTGLHGCTAIFIVSEKGVYMAHIFEIPVFKEERNYITPTDEDFFQEWAFHALIRGNAQSEVIEPPIQDLIGTVNEPGPLHYTNRPIIHIMSPFKTGGIGPLKFAPRIQWVANQFHDYLYPSEAANFDQPVVTAGYKAYKQIIAEQPRNLGGKAILEFSPLDRYDQDGNNLNPMAHWRLFNAGEKMAEQWFHNPAALSSARQGQTRRDESDGICPRPMFNPDAPTSTSSTPSSSTTNPPSSLIPSNPAASASATPTTPPLPNDASNIKGPICADNKDIDVEIDNAMVEDLADVCLDHMLPPETDTMGPQRERISWSIGKGWNDWYYAAEIHVAEDCQGQGQNLMLPMEGHDCRELLKGNFNNETCKAGGTTQVGCLVFGSWVKEDDDDDE
ncbi:hypothetical protein BDV18DRAFT_157446 [Aspergillus unguis]